MENSARDGWTDTLLAVGSTVDTSGPAWGKEGACVAGSGVQGFSLDSLSCTSPAICPRDHKSGPRPSTGFLFLLSFLKLGMKENSLDDF